MNFPNETEELKGNISPNPKSEVINLVNVNINPFYMEPTRVKTNETSQYINPMSNESLFKIKNKKKNTLKNKVPRIKKTKNVYKNKTNKITKTLRKILPIPQKPNVIEMSGRLIHPETSIFLIKLENDSKKEEIIKNNGYQHNLQIENNKKLIIHSCDRCSYISVNEDNLRSHASICVSNPKPIPCVGCKNVFFSFISLRIHLLHDHNADESEVKVILKNIETLTDIEVLTISDADFNHYPVSHYNEMSQCLNSNKPTMLETYLNELNHKSGSHLPHNGPDILENTFNFTAPVSEQLPEIQPPSETPSAPLEEPHLLADSENQHTNHGYLSMASVYPENHNPSSFKSNLTHSYGLPRHEPPNIVSYLQDNYCSPHLEIPVIDIDDTNVEQAHLLSSQTPSRQDVMDMFKSDFQLNYNDTTNDCQVVEEVTKEQEQKKHLKKLGFGFRCDINGCKIRLQSEENIQYHRRCHEGNLFNCPECCKDCSSWLSLSSHLWQAHKIDMDLYKCDVCPYKTPSYSRLSNIHRGIHGNARPFMCEICGRRFKTGRQMRNHRATHKAKIVSTTDYQCNICGRNISDKRQLQLHVNNVHKKKKPYSCSLCSFSTAVRHSLVVHTRKHTGDKPYKCDKCEFKTADHNSLRRHNMKHTGARNYKCSQCSYSCIQSTTYKVHMKTKHPGIATEVMFSCNQCNFQTLKNGLLMSHMSEHEPSYQQRPEKPNTPLLTHERVVDNIIDLSQAHDLLEDDYYERITGDLEEPMEPPELKFKSNAIT